MRRLTALLTALSSLALCVAALPATDAGAADIPIMLGMRVPNESLSIIPSLTAWQQGKVNAFLDTQQGWNPVPPGQSVGTSDGGTVGMLDPADDGVFDELKAIWAAGSIPELAWYPQTKQPSDDRAIARGSLDPYLLRFCARLRAFLAGPDGVYGTGDDRRILLRFAPEANGDWHSYSPTYGLDKSQTLAEKENALGFVLMWQHVHNVFLANALDPSHVAWVFSVNNVDAGWNGVPIMEQLYPGDAFVDWVGIDGYNRGDRTADGITYQWSSPDQVFDPMLDRVRAVTTRPIGVSEVGTSALLNGSTSTTAKGQWLQDLGAWASTGHGAGIRMLMYWDEDTNGNDYSVFGGSQGPYDDYRDVISAPRYVGATASNPRIVSDAVFLGTG